MALAAGGGSFRVGDISELRHRKNRRWSVDKKITVSEDANDGTDRSIREGRSVPSHYTQLSSTQLVESQYTAWYSFLLSCRNKIAGPVAPPPCQDTSDTNVIGLIGRSWLLEVGVD